MLGSKRYFAPFDAGLFRTSYSYKPWYHKNKVHNNT